MPVMSFILYEGRRKNRRHYLVYNLHGFLKLCDLFTGLKQLCIIRKIKGQIVSFLRKRTIPLLSFHCKETLLTFLQLFGYSFFKLPVERPSGLLKLKRFSVRRDKSLSPVLFK